MLSLLYVTFFFLKEKALTRTKDHPGELITILLEQQNVVTCPIYPEENSQLKNLIGPRIKHFRRDPQ